MGSKICSQLICILSAHFQLGFSSKLKCPSSARLGSENFQLGLARAGKFQLEPITNRCIQKILLITPYILTCTIVCLGFYSSSWSTVGLMVHVREESEIFSLSPSIQDILPKWCLGQPDSFSPSASTKWHTFYFLKPPVTGSYCLDRQYQKRAPGACFASALKLSTTAAHLKRAQPKRSLWCRRRHRVALFVVSL